MKRLKLIINEKGMFVEIPGVSKFRTPAEVDVTKVKLNILVQSLHSCGITDYQIVSFDNKETKTYTKSDFDIPKKIKAELEIDDRLDRVEELLLTLLSKNQTQKVNSSEQITNRLNRIEKMIRYGSNFTYTEKNDGRTRVEELEEQYIPEIDVSDMKLSGKSIEVIQKSSKEDIDDAVDLLSGLIKNGGR